MLRALLQEMRSGRFFTTAPLLALIPPLVWFIIGSHAAGGEIASEQPRAHQDVAMLTLTATDNGKTVTGRVGDEIAVELSENPTTGFVWMVDSSDNEHFTEVTTEFTPARGDLLGAGGQRRFVFRLEKVGEARISLNLKRDWEGGKTTAADHFAITITINEKAVQ